MPRSACTTATAISPSTANAPPSRIFAIGCADLGSALRTLAIWWNQHRCSPVPGKRVSLRPPETPKRASQSQDLSSSPRVNSCRSRSHDLLFPVSTRIVERRSNDSGPRHALTSSAHDPII
jgi:hypothetical protein